MRKLFTSLLLALFVTTVRGQQLPVPRSPESLKAEIDSLKVAKPAWREITWKSCLLEGLKESRSQRKPVLCWIFIDRPADDARC